MFEQLNEDEYDFEDFGEIHSSPESPREVEDYISDQDEEEKKPKSQGMKLNLGKPQTNQQRPMGMGALNLGAVKKSEDEAPKVPAIKGFGQLPQQQDGTNSQEPSSSNRGFGLDIAKATQVQQELMKQKEKVDALVKNKKAPADSGSSQNSNSSRVLEMRFANVSGRMGEVKEEESKGTSSDEIMSSSGENFELLKNEMQDKTIPPEKIDDEKFEMMGTTRNDYTNEYYKYVCSEVVPSFIYLGGDKVAQNKDLL